MNGPSDGAPVVVGAAFISGAGAEARAREMSAAVDRAVRAALRKLGVETTEDDG